MTCTTHTQGIAASSSRLVQGITHSAEVTARPAPLPLYICDRGSKRVRADGAALVLEHAERAPVRYPLARISRIICHSAVEWSATALAACLGARIPVVFLNNLGEATGYLQPVRVRLASLSALIEETLDRPDGFVILDNWIRSERMQMVQCWRQLRARSGHPVPHAEYAERVRVHVYRRAPDTSGVREAALWESAVMGMVLERLERADLCPVYWGVGGKPFCWAVELRDLLCLSVALHADGLGAAMHGDVRAMLALVHRLMTPLERRCDELGKRLQRQLAQVLETWR